MKNIITKKALIGLAFLLSLVMIYFGINFLKGVNVVKRQNTYIAVFSDVTGLNISSPVLVKGFQIGLVNSIKMLNNDPLTFAVEVRLDNDFKLKQGSRLEFGADFLGSSTVSLILNEESKNYLAYGDTIVGGRAPGMLDGVSSVVPKADSILANINETVLTLNNLMSNPAWEQTINGIGKTANELHTASVSLNTIMASLKKELPAISSNLSAVSTDIKEITAEINALNITKTYLSLDDISTNLQYISAKINSTDNSLGKLMNETVLYDSLNITLDNAAKLLEEIRLNPEKYLSVKVRLF